MTLLQMCLYFISFKVMEKMSYIPFQNDPSMLKVTGNLFLYEKNWSNTNAILLVYFKF